MPTEIERKFIVKGNFFADVIDSQCIVQGYLCSEPGRTVRVRIRGSKGYLTIKGPSDEKGLSRYEFQQEVPLADAEQLLKLCEPGIIDKMRFLVYAGRRIWEVDVFHGANAGLVIAEIELHYEDEPFKKPHWLGEEVSGDKRYYNSMLSKEPYSGWAKK